jgi:HAD superfamily hydrolase (TIGR01549 family)
MIKLICFDLWSTLATRSNIKYHFSDTLKKEFNLNIKKQEIINLFEETVQTKYWETEIDAHSEFLKKINLPITKENIFKITAIRDKAENNIKLYDFTITLLKQLKEKRYKIGLITNSSIFIYNLVKENTDLLNYIDYPLFSFQISVVKPNLQIYLEMQSKSKFENTEILMIGDNYLKDVITPQKLGWNTIHFKGSYNKLKKDLEKYSIFIK